MKASSQPAAPRANAPRAVKAANSQRRRATANTSATPPKMMARRSTGTPNATPNQHRRT
jgi:hypothetical protein